MSPTNIPVVSDIISPTCPCWHGIWQTTYRATHVMFSRRYPWVEPPERTAHGAYVLRYKLWEPEHTRDRVHDMPVKRRWGFIKTTSLRAWQDVLREFDWPLRSKEIHYEKPPEGQGEDWHRQEWERRRDIQNALDVLMAVGKLTERKREIYELSEIELWTHAEIARELKVGRNYIHEVMREMEGKIKQFMQSDLNRW